MGVIVSMAIKCIQEKCKKLLIETDGAGGETYKCRKNENDCVIFGEIAHWAGKEDYPKPVCDETIRWDS